MTQYAVHASFSFCYGHRLQGYNGPCRHLHGHNARVELIVEREALDAQGMVCDFRTLKDTAKTWVDAHFDHRMLLQDGDPMLALLREHDEPVYVFEHPPTAENIAREIYLQMQKAELPLSEVRVWESETSYASYRAK